MSLNRCSIPRPGLTWLVLLSAAACGGSPAQKTTPTGSNSGSDAAAMSIPANAYILPSGSGSDPSDDTPEATEGIAVAVRQASASGTYATNMLRHYVRRSGLLLAGCYPTDASAPQHADVTVELDIKADGHATPTVSGIDPSTAQCIVDVIQSITFPKPSDGQPLHASVQLEYFPPPKT